MHQDSSASALRRDTPVWGFRYLAIAGWVLLAIWTVWWGDALYEGRLLFGKNTLISYPLFGADFYSQSDMAARLWAGGVDPYASRGHLFHYPPLVIRLFLWTPYFAPEVALRIWIVVCMLLVVGGTLLALHIRKKLPVAQIPTSFALAAVLFSFPVVFELERANFDLLTLAAMLVAFWLFAKGKPIAEVLGGCFLAVGPWVKLYPGIMALGLIALRRWQAFAGFVVAAIAIGLAAPAETKRSFDVLQIAVERVKNVSQIVDQAPWGHSYSIAWMKTGQAIAGTPIGKLMLRIPGDAVAGAMVIALSGWVCFRLYRLGSGSTLLYPLLLWLNALGSCIGAIANDYSLAFLPLAAIAVHSFKDSWLVRISMVLMILWWQPLDLKLNTSLLLAIKLMGLIGVGVSLVWRARQLAAEREALPAEPEALPARA